MTKFPIQKILFDLDGTLVDTASDLHVATNHALSSIGVPEVPFEVTRPFVGFGAVKLIDTGLSYYNININSVSIENLKRVFLDYYRENIAVHSRLFPDGLALLTRLKAAGIEIGLCTNKPEDLALKLLEEIEIYEYFGAISGGDTFEFKKPDPRHLTETAAMLKGNGPIIMVGDSSPDILSAQAADIPVIAMKHGYHDVNIEELGPDLIAPDLATLLLHVCCANGDPI